MDVKLTISEIQSIKIRGGKMQVEGHMDYEDAERAVIEIWELYGDEFLINLLEAEGWYVTSKPLQR
jgi:hypothetical protein